jgi:transglutaminase-like putative cysteine protease
MSPGGIASLSQSDALAFNVKFLGARPKQTELYWHGIVLQHFDGNSWTQFAQQLDAEAVKSRLKTNQRNIHQRLVQHDDSKAVRIEYEVIYEKSGRSWLFALTPVAGIKGDAFFGSDFRIIANQDLSEPMLLNLLSYPHALRDVHLPTASRERSLQLPEQGNEQSRALAQQLLAASTSQQDYIDTILKRYQQQAFYYTLRPPLMDRSNSIDDFLLNRKKGFCEHYAGSFVFMMRAAGIPARVIVGYQGGEWNDNGNFLSVRQYDAHAWTEVWLDNQGWVRFDPTAMVAPQRIEHNLQTAMDEEGSFLEAQTFSLSKNQWLVSLRQRIDATQYAWRRFVLSYDSDSQTRLLKRLFGDLSVQQIALLVGGLFAAIIVLWVMVLGLGKKHVSIAAEHQLYRRFCDFLEQQGIVREPSQTPEAFSQVAMAQLPQLSSEIKTFTEVYSALCYEPDQHEIHQQNVSRLKGLLKTMKRRR